MSEWNFGRSRLCPCCEHVCSHTHMPQELYTSLRTWERRVIISNPFHSDMLRLYYRDVVITFTQSGKQLASLRTASRATYASVPMPTMISSWAHGSIHASAQADMDMKVIFQELHLQTYILIHTAMLWSFLLRGGHLVDYLRIEHFGKECQ